MKLVSFAFCVLLLVSWAKANRLALRAATAVDDAGCQGRLDWSKFAKLNQICDECYSLYKEIDVYRLCRSDCFGTKIFYGCMEALLVKDELKSEVAALLDEAHTGYYDPLSKKK